MWILGAFLLHQIAGARSQGIDCSDWTPKKLTASRSSYEIPYGYFYDHTKCKLKITFPNDTMLRVELVADPEDYKRHKFTVTDSLGRTKRIRSPVVYFSPPEVTFNMKIGSTDLMPFFRFDSATFTAVKLKPFTKIQKYPITPGSEPLILTVKQLANGTTYVFTGYPTLSAYYLPKNKSPSGATIQSLLAYKGADSTASMVGTVGQWQGQQKFSNLSIYNTGYNGDQLIYDDRLLIVDSFDLSDYRNPVIFQDYYFTKIVKLNANKGKTFATFLAHEQGELSRAHYYLLSNVTCSNKEGQFLLVDGLPRIAEAKIIQRFNCRDLQPGFHMELGGTKTIVLLNGTMSFKYLNEGLPNYVQYNDGMVGYARRDKEGSEAFWQVTNPNHDLIRFTLNWKQYKSGSYLRVQGIYGDGGSENFTASSAEWSFATRDDVVLSLYGMATLQYTVTTLKRTDPSTTVAPAYEGNWVPWPVMNPTDPPSESEDCIRFRFFDCIASFNPWDSQHWVG